MKTRSASWFDFFCWRLAKAGIGIRCTLAFLVRDFILFYSIDIIMNQVHNTVYIDREKIYSTFVRSNRSIWIFDIVMIIQTVKSSIIAHSEKTLTTRNFYYYALW